MPRGSPSESARNLGEDVIQVRIEIAVGPGQWIDQRQVHPQEDSLRTGSKRRSLVASVSTTEIWPEAGFTAMAMQMFINRWA